MTRGRLFAAVAAAGAALASAAASASAAGTIAVAPARSTFPERAFVLTLPTGTALDPGSVQVLENGLRVDELRSIAAQKAGGRSFGIVLALDASNSMRGKPAAAALAAARAFADARAPAAALGLVSFNSATKVVLQPSTSAAAIAGALRQRPRLAEGTWMRDAVARAIALLERARVTAGSVVVLSDGADTGSRTTLARLVRLAGVAHVRIFAVGLRSGQFDPAGLRTLARTTGGRYAEATNASELGPLYRELGRELASEYLIHYRSAAAPGSHVRVAVRVAGFPGVATFAYEAPSGTGTVFGRSWEDRFWRSSAGPVATAALAALLAAVAILLVLRTLRPSAGARVAAYVGVAPRGRRRDDRTAERAVQLLDRSLSHVRGWRAFARDVEIARIPAAPSELAAATALASLLLGPVLAFAASRPVLLLLAFAPPIVARSVVKRRLRRLRRRFEDELPDNIQVLASALRAGHGLSGALRVVADDATEPARTEFERALADERLGTPLEDALAATAERMASGDLGQVALVTALHRETGGNTAEVLDRVHDSLRARAELRGLVRSLTAEGRMTRWVLTALPVVVAAAITVLNRDYLSPLLDTNAGRALLGVAAAMVVAGSLVIKRIVEIEL